MNEKHGLSVNIALGCGSFCAVSLGPAIDRPGEAGINPGHGGNERRISGPKNMPGGGVAPVLFPKVDEAVAEYPVVNEVVGDGQIEGLIECIQRLWRPREDRSRDNGEDCERNSNSASIWASSFMAAAPCHRAEARNTGTLDARG